METQYPIQYAIDLLFSFIKQVTVSTTEFALKDTPWEGFHLLGGFHLLSGFSRLIVGGFLFLRWKPTGGFPLFLVEPPGGPPL